MCSRCVCFLYAATFDIVSSLKKHKCQPTNQFLVTISRKTCPRAETVAKTAVSPVPATYPPLNSLIPPPVSPLPQTPPYPVPLLLAGYALLCPPQLVEEAEETEATETEAVRRTTAQLESLVASLLP